MSERRVVIPDQFLDRMAAIEQYLGQQDPARGREFSAELLDFLYDTIGVFPLAFPAYQLPRYPDLLLRRAVFQRYYIVLYEVSEEEVKFVALFASSQDAGRISL